MRTSKNLVLTAMVFAVAMTFIDQTIVAIAIPNIQHEVHLSQTGSQWVINGYLLSLSALFAFGGKLADVLGRRNVVTAGVVAFAVASACCGLTPTGSIGQAWIIFFRVAQGAAAAMLFPAAVGIVIASFPVNERGKAMAMFFGISGGLTAIGPIAGGFLTQWTWRSIFWINIPVAIIALILIRRSQPDNERHPGSLDYRGTTLVTGAMALIILGLQQSSVWGWNSALTWACVIVGALLMVAFIRFELRCEEPLLNLRIFKDRAFAVDNVVLGAMSVVFIPFFFFASVYSQASLGKTASDAGLYMFYFFIGFVILAQVGGRLLDSRGAKLPVTVGCIIGAIGFFLLARKLTDLDLGSQRFLIMLAGGGLGLILGPASTDAVNRTRTASYSEVTGITQTSRNFGASLGMAVLGAIMISTSKSNVATQLTKAGVPSRTAHNIGSSLGLSASSAGGSAAHRPEKFVHAVQLGFAQSTQTVFYIMAAVLALTFFVARRMPKGVAPVVQPVESPAGERGAGVSAGPPVGSVET